MEGFKNVLIAMVAGVIVGNLFVISFKLSEIIGILTVIN